MLQVSDDPAFLAAGLAIRSRGLTPGVRPATVALRPPIERQLAADAHRRELRPRLASWNQRFDAVEE